MHEAGQCEIAPIKAAVGRKLEEKMQHTHCGAVALASEENSIYDDLELCHKHD